MSDLGGRSGATNNTDTVQIVGSPSIEESPLPGQFEDHPTWARLNEQLRWYERSSSRNQRGYKVTKTVQIILAASIPIIALANADWSAWGAAVLGAVIAVLEGVQQLWRSDTLWIEYRSTAERLKQEKYLFLAMSGPYRGLGVEEALKLLAERVEERVSAEGARWAEAIRPTQKEQ